MKKKAVHTKFLYVIDGDGNHLSCKDAVDIAVKHFSTEYFEEAEPGIWIVWDCSERPWAFQTKGSGFTIDTPYISWDDINPLGKLMVKLWEAGMRREIQQIGPFDSRGTFDNICKTVTVRYNDTFVGQHFLSISK